MIGRLITMVALLGGVLSAQATTSPSDQVKLVTRLYHDFAWEAVISEPLQAGPSLIDSSSTTLGLYFTDELAQLIVKDRKQAMNTQETGNLDFCPIWASQDPAATDLKITHGPKPNTVRVCFLYPGSGKKIHLSYELARTLRGWKIADIRYDEGFSLKEILRGPEAKSAASRKSHD